MRTEQTRAYLEAAVEDIEVNSALLNPVDGFQGCGLSREVRPELHGLMVSLARSEGEDVFHSESKLSLASLVGEVIRSTLVWCFIN